MRYLKIFSICTLFSVYSNSNAQCPTAPNAWDASNVINGASLSITSGGAAGTSCKLTVSQGPNNNGVAVVRDDMDSAETRYRARFYIDPTNIMNNATGSTQRVKIFVATNLDNPVPTSLDTRGRPSLIQMFLVPLGGNQARLGGFCRDLNSHGTRARFGEDGTVSLQSGWNTVEVEVVVGNGTGACRIWVNNNTESSPNWEKTSMNNALLVGVTKANIGNSGSTRAYSDNIGNQQVHFDEFESRRQTFIGF